MRSLRAGVDPQTFFRDLAAVGSGLLMLDYDGTLAPFHARPMLAQPYEGVMAAIDAILSVGGTRVVILSGRRVDEIVALLGPVRRRPEIWGLDGWQRLMPDGAVTVKSADAVYVQLLQQAHAAIRATLPEPVRIELKPASIAVHWRGHTALAAAKFRRAVIQVCRGLSGGDGLQSVPIEEGLKLHDPALDRSPVWEILEQSPEGLPVAYLGDDVTDEDGFAAVGDSGLAVLVRANLRNTQAALWIRTPRELLALLSQWHAAMHAALGDRSASRARTRAASPVAGLDAGTP